jgi:hypothetical protein
MDIFDLTPRKIRCIANYDTPFTPSNCLKNLEVGKEYTLDYLVVHGWYTEVFLEEIDGIFNSVLFEEVE